MIIRSLLKGIISFLLIFTKMVLKVSSNDVRSRWHQKVNVQRRESHALNFRSIAHLDYNEGKKLSASSHKSHVNHYYKSQIKGKESENSYQELNRSRKGCSETFTLFRLRKTTVPVEISRFSFRVCVCLSFCDLFNSW